MEPANLVLQVLARDGTAIILFGSGGIVGPAGPAGPQGPPGADGTGSGGTPDGGELLSGAGAPASGSGLDALDGINDPWRWSATLGAWVGPAYEVTWATGDVIPPLTVLDDTPGGGTSSLVTFYIAPGSSLSDVTTATQAFGQPAQAWADPTPPRSLQSPSASTAVADGPGIAFAVQTPYDYVQDTVPDPAFDITTQLGDVVVGSAYTFPEPPAVGVDGDFYLDTATTDLYGPKTAGSWGTPVNIRGFDPSVFHALTAGLYLGPNTDPDEASLSIASGVETPDGYLSPGQVALWYESTTGAPVVHFKAKDDAGTVYVAELPMTLAP